MRNSRLNFKFLLPKLRRVLTDSSEKFNLLYKFFGISTPEKQINANILFNVAGAVLSILLFRFLMGYFNAQANKNPAVGTPTIIYLVYAFLIFIAAWQFLGFIMNAQLKSKFAGRNKNQTRTDSSARENEIASAETQELLPEAEFSNIAMTSVT